MGFLKVVLWKMSLGHCLAGVRWKKAEVINVVAKVLLSHL
jgi:hypothetical protein